MTNEELNLIIAETFRGINELNKSIDKTNRSIEKLDKSIEKLKESQDRTDEQMKRTDEQMARTDIKLEELMDKSYKIDEQMARTDIKLEELMDKSYKIDEQMARTDIKLENVGKMVGRLTNTMGEESEYYFLKYFESHKYLGNIKFDEIKANKRFGDQESDIVLINGVSIGIVSVKHKLKKNDVDNLINKELENIKNDFHIKSDENKKIYLGVAGYITDQNTETYAMKKGLFVFTRKGDDVQVLNDKNFIAKVF